MLKQSGRLQRLHRHRFHAMTCRRTANPASCAFSIAIWRFDTGMRSPPPAEDAGDLTAYSK
ncbi:hypothetical protein KCP75_20635 [Salmonella enterica subsp. enterica]|nr:hypothetical protein KCP75_20635 [Salmonella enterica subsp. enterica]